MIVPLLIAAFLCSCTKTVVDNGMNTDHSSAAASVQTSSTMDEADGTTLPDDSGDPVDQPIVAYYDTDVIEGSLNASDDDLGVTCQKNGLIRSKFRMMLMPWEDLFVKPGDAARKD